MLKSLALQKDSAETLRMPDQVLGARFTDQAAAGLSSRAIPKAARLVLFGLPLAFSVIVGSILAAAFRTDGQLSFVEATLVALMALLSGWEAFPTANALIGFNTTPKSSHIKAQSPLSIAILATIRGENAHDVIPGKLNLLRALQQKSNHSFAVHVLSDSPSLVQVEDERHLVRAASALSVFYHHRPVNTDYKSGNVRNWINGHGAAYDAFIILDADSELNHNTALALANSLAADSACGLIQTVPAVLAGGTHWQGMQAVASRVYGGLQGRGLSAWMGDEANYFGHNAIIRTKAFAACAGLPHLEGRGLWNGTILSHDFVEAALLRRAGWAVRLLPAETGSFEQAPADVISHLRRDARWCLGNFQHSRILGAAGLHPMSRFHLLGGIFTYLSSVVWLATLVLWATLDAAQAGAGGNLATSAFLLIAINLLLPRVLGTLYVTARLPGTVFRWRIAKTAIIETLFSSLFAPSLMLQRVMIIGRILANRRITWAPHEKANRNFMDYCVFHVLELIAGLGLLAFLERGLMTCWFLPLAICLASTPALSCFAAQPTKHGAHENLNEASSL